MHSTRWMLPVCMVFGCGAVVAKGPPIDSGPVDGGPIDTPPDGPHIVFVTSTTIAGGMLSPGGLAGADAFCQSRAKAANLAGTYLAWLAAGSVTPASRMVHHTGPYQLTTGDVIAQGWTDLTDGTLAARIDRTETQAQSSGVRECLGGGVWSNVDAAATCAPGSPTAAAGPASPTVTPAPRATSRRWTPSGRRAPASRSRAAARSRSSASSSSAQAHRL
ncbi:MAG TPA: hypothetical protein VF469_10785 [Kofleriaceae bacterium]